MIYRLDFDIVVCYNKNVGKQKELQIMKRKVLGLTMNVSKVYNSKHENTHTEYTFLNPVTNSVMNSIIMELGTEYSMVQSEVTDFERNTDYGIIEVYEGKILCYNKEQTNKYFKENFCI